MRWPLLTMTIEREDDVVAARQRAHRIAAELGFGVQDRTRIATAVSEIARNAYGYAGGGKVEFGIDELPTGQDFVVRVSDCGDGIADLEAILEGRYRSPSGLGIGITGARRLMDRFDLRSEAGQGTTVTLAKHLPDGARPLTGPILGEVAERVIRRPSDDPHAALRERNKELLQSLSELAEREEEARRLNAELAETNRGVVARYAQLETPAARLRAGGSRLVLQTSPPPTSACEPRRPSASGWRPTFARSRRWRPSAS